MRLLSIFICPPIAIGRLGESAQPLEAFDWQEDPATHGAGRTVIVPAVTLAVEVDGSVTPYRPGAIRFRDAGLYRPVAPFFELWACCADVDGAQKEMPLTRALLAELGSRLESVRYTVTAVNLKAARRTGDPACGYRADASFAADSYDERELLASSPHAPGQEPLVFAEQPISLGRIRAVRPRIGMRMGVDLDVLRIRFTPAAGFVYGPPGAGSAAAPGTSRLHEIVPAERRVLNPASSWIRYDADYATYDNPEPSDPYDGADTDRGRAWSVVDDTCDMVLEASMALDGERFLATARAVSGPPDFAPDRRPFVSLADDLADRDLDDPCPDELMGAAEVADLFQRVFETLSLMNLDAVRARAVVDNSGGAGTPGLPLTDAGTMTVDDRGWADDKLLSQLDPAEPSRGVAHFRLPYAQAAASIHAPLTSAENLLDLLRDFPDRVRKLMRPPWGAFGELPPEPAAEPDPGEIFRDPRVPRDGLHDMRMPPYMRDSDARALSLTRRQYRQLMVLVTQLAEQRHLIAGQAPNGTLMAEAPHAVPGRLHEARFIERRRRSGEGA